MSWYAGNIAGSWQVRCSTADYGPCDYWYEWSGNPNLVDVWFGVNPNPCPESVWLDGVEFTLNGSYGGKYRFSSVGGVPFPGVDVPISLTSEAPTGHVDWNTEDWPENCQFLPTDNEEFDVGDPVSFNLLCPSGWKITEITVNGVSQELPDGVVLMWADDIDMVSGGLDVHVTMAQIGEWSASWRFVVAGGGIGDARDVTAGQTVNIDEFPEVLGGVLNRAVLKSTDSVPLEPGLYTLSIGDPGSQISQFLVPDGNNKIGLEFPGISVDCTSSKEDWTITFSPSVNPGTPGDSIDDIVITPDSPGGDSPEEPDEEIQYLPTPEIPELPTVSGSCTDPCLCDINETLRYIASRLGDINVSIVQAGNLVSNAVFNHGVSLASCLNSLSQQVDEAGKDVVQGLGSLSVSVDDAAEALSGSIDDGVEDLVAALEEKDCSLFLEVAEGIQVLGDQVPESERGDY